MARYLDPLGLPKSELTHLADSLATASPALMRQLCENLKRQIVVGPKVGWNMHRDAVFDRMLASFGPHPDLGKPRLWSHGSKDIAIRSMTWPLQRANEIVDEAPVPERSDNVVSIGRGA